MKQKIGIATLYTGFNYGSSLQATAIKYITESFGFETEILKIKGSLIKGRDIRLKKLFIILTRGFFYKEARKILFNYKKSYEKNIDNKILKLFEVFTLQYISPKLVTYRKLKSVAKNSEYKAFLCGSDQIWSAVSLYVDPFYYLQFCPNEKK